MAKKSTAKFWCIATSHPLVQQVAEKYNLDAKDARTIVNNAKANDAALQLDDISLPVLENSDAFKDALHTYSQQFIDDEALLDKVPGIGAANPSAKDILRKELEQMMSPEEAEDVMSLYSDIRLSRKANRETTAKVAKLFAAFKNPNRLGFIGEFVSHYVSDVVTKLESDPNKRNELGIARHGKRIEYLTDTDSVEAIKDEIFNTLTEQADTLRNEGKTTLADELDAAADNLDTLLYIYGRQLFSLEGVSVDPNGVFTTPNMGQRITEEDMEDDDDVDNEIPSSPFSASEQNQSVLTKLVPNIKVLLSGITDMTSESEEKTDPYGYGLWTYIPLNRSVNKLLHLCNSCHTYAEMIDVLDRNRRAIPWVGQLLSGLDTQNTNDASGTVTVSKSKKEQLQTMFFKSMRKALTLFRNTYNQRDNNGDLIMENSEVNRSGVATSLTRQLTSKFSRMSNLPIFSKEGIDFDYIRKNLLPAVVSDINSSINKAALLAADAEKKQGSLKDAFDTLKDGEKKLRDTLKSLGINVTNDILNDYLSNTREDRPQKKKSRDREDFDLRVQRMRELRTKTETLVRNLLEWGEAQKSKLTTDTPRTNPFKYRQSDYAKISYIRNWYNNIIAAVSDFSTDSIEPNAYSNGKNRYAHNNPSTLSNIIDRLTGTPQRVRDYIMEKYGKDPVWFMKKSDDDKPHFYSWWLESLYHSPKGTKIELSEKPVSCKTDYMDQTDTQYALSILNDYFLPVELTDTDDPTAWYRMLINSDKPRFASIRFRKYNNNDTADDEGRVWTEDNYHSVIARQAVDFFTQELKRAAEVISAARNNDNTELSIRGYDIAAKGAAKTVLNKIAQGKRITIGDVLDDRGRYIFRGSGASFFLNKFLNKEIEDKTELGQYIVDKIFNSHKRIHTKAEWEQIDRDIIPVFKEAFHSYMQGVADRTFRQYFDIGMFLPKTQTETVEGERITTMHLSMLRGQMAQWNRNRNPQIQEALRTAMYSNDNLAQEVIDKYFLGSPSIKETGMYAPYFYELAGFRQMLEEFVYNNWMAKANMSQIFDVDLAFYGDTTNFQKRNAQVISSGYEIDPDARLHGKKVSDGKYRSITLAAPKVSSEHLANIKSHLYKEIDKITDPVRRNTAKANIDKFLGQLGRMDVTDGQAFTSLSGLRKRMVGLGEWSRSDNEELDKRGYVEVDGKRSYIFTDEAVYRRMKRGETLPEDLEHVFAQPQKPFVYSYVQVDRNGRSVTVPVQHKNSEYALIFAAAFSANGKSISELSPIEAIARFLEDTADNEDIRGIDTVNFDSGVKIGRTNREIDVKDLSGKEVYASLKDAVYGEKRQTDEAGIVAYSDYVTEYDVQDYKIVQEKPEHLKNGNQPIGSQLKVLVVANMPNSATIELPDGSTITGKELKQRYFDALNRKTDIYVQKFSRELGLGMPSANRLHKLSNMLLRSMASDQKFGPDMRKALTITTREGADQFGIPLDDPGIQSAVESMLYSKIRKQFYRQGTKGGIAVQVTSWGASEDLAIRFYSSDPRDKDGLLKTKKEFAKAYNIAQEGLDNAYGEYVRQYQQGYAYHEFEISMPNHIRRYLLGKDGLVDKKYYNKDGSWNMEAIRKVVPERLLDAIAYRIPTEGKNSMMVGKVVRFTPEASGSVAKFPLELVQTTGSDFDIDTDTIELRPDGNDVESVIDDEIFNYQIAALKANPSALEMFSDGDFTDVKELSYKTTLLLNGYTADQVDKMSAGEIKQRCNEIEDLDLMSPVTDVVLHNQNADAKDMIGIAAVGVTSHAFLSMYSEGEDPDDFVRIQFFDKSRRLGNQTFMVENDKQGEKNAPMLVVSGPVHLDPMYDMDGNLVSSVIRKYVGGSADAAKDAALYRLNINKRTLPVLVFMHRLGISGEMARMFISQPIIRDLVRNLNAPTEYGVRTIDTSIENLFGEIADRHNMNIESVMDTWRSVCSQSHTLRYSDLLNGLASDTERKERASAFEELKLLHLFQVMQDKANSLRNLDGFTRYNSQRAMTGTSFIDRYVTRLRLDKLKTNLDAEEEQATILLPQNVEIAEGFENSNFGRLCSMFPYVAKTIISEERLADDIIVENMHTYNPSFFEAIDMLTGTNDEFVLSADTMKDLYSGWKSYLLFVGDNRIADFRDKATAEYYTRDFASAFFSRLDKLQLKNKKFYDEVIEGNSFIRSIGLVSVNGNSSRNRDPKFDEFNVLTTNITGLAGEVLERYQDDWAELLNYPETRQLAIDTAIHFLARSAAFSRDTPVTVMPTAIKEAIPNYIKAFQDADKQVIGREELDRFLFLYRLNNVDDRSIVPQFRRSTNPNVIGTEFYPIDDQPGMGIIRFNKNSRTLANWVEKAKDAAGNTTGLILRSPIIVLDGSVFLVDTENPMEENEKQYSVQAVEIDPLGIPNKLAEYTWFGDLPTSMFHIGKIGTSAGEDFRDEAPFVEGSSIQMLSPDTIADGQKIGTFMELTPFRDIEDRYAEMSLSKDLARATNDQYLESRTQIKRQQKIVSALGMKLSSIQRGQIGSEGTAGFVLQLTPTGREDQHEQAMRVAAVLGALSFEKTLPAVRTYTKNIDEADAFELSIKLKQNGLSDRGKIISTAKKLGIDMSLNVDSGELQFVNSLQGLSENEVASVVEKRVRAVNAMLSKLKAAGYADDNITVNYLRYDRLDKETQLNILKDIQHEARTREQEDAESQRPIGQYGPAGRRQIRLSDIADVALRRANGEQINDEVRALFGETRMPLRPQSISYQSDVLTDLTIEVLDEDIYDSLYDILSQREDNNRTAEDMLDATIVNTANWILGNMDNAALVNAYTAIGMTAENAESIISLIKQKLEELDIC